MINPKSRTIEWIAEAAVRLGIRDCALVEKTIRAFSLLEALARSGCPFVFKGGSSLMLHLNTSRRLSIDIDIICPPGTQIENYLMQYAQEYGFGKVELVERIARTDVPKQHAKFYCPSHNRDSFLQGRKELLYGNHQATLRCGISL